MRITKCHISTLENNQQKILDEWIMDGTLDLVCKAVFFIDEEQTLEEEEQ